MRIFIKTLQLWWQCNRVFPPLQEMYGCGDDGFIGKKKSFKQRAPSNYSFLTFHSISITAYKSRLLSAMVAKLRKRRSRWLYSSESTPLRGSHVWRSRSSVGSSVYESRSVKWVTKLWWFMYVKIIEWSYGELISSRITPRLKRLLQNFMVSTIHELFSELLNLTKRYS